MFFSACEITINEEKITRQYSNSIIKNLEEQFPKEVLNDLDVFSVLNVEQFPTNIHSLEFAIYGNDEIKLLSDHFQIGSKGLS